MIIVIRRMVKRGMYILVSFVSYDVSLFLLIATLINPISIYLLKSICSYCIGRISYTAYFSSIVSFIVLLDIMSLISAIRCVFFSSTNNLLSSPILFSFRNLRETDKESITLPSNLTNTQRKFVHELSKQMGLKSKSHGKGEQRCITVSKVQSSSSGGLMMMGGNPNQTKDKKKDENSLPTLKEYKQVPKINIGKRGEEALVQHLLKFPPNEKELAESKETGSSLILLKRKTAAADGATSGATVDDDEGGDVVVANQTSGEQQLLSLNDILPPPQQTTDTAATPSSHQTQEQQQKIQAKKSRILNQRIQSHHTLQQQTKQHSDYKKMMKQRQNLPAYSYATDICNVLKNKKNQVVILTGDTGCGYVMLIVFVLFI